jgi:hypothetical protein
MAVLRFCLNKFWPLSKDWFPWRIRGWWPLLVVAACSLFPIVQSVSAFNQDMLSPLLPETPSINVAMAELIGLKDPVRATSNGTPSSPHKRFRREKYCMSSDASYAG